MRRANCWPPATSARITTSRKAPPVSPTASRTSPAMAASRLKAALAALVLATGLASPALAATPQTDWDHVARVVVFGDLHGDYGKFHDMLVQAHLVDAHDNWSGGRTHLVQV